jgi:hypothetical protein
MASQQSEDGMFAARRVIEDAGGLDRNGPPCLSYYCPTPLKVNLWQLFSWFGLYNCVWLNSI